MSSKANLWRLIATLLVIGGAAAYVYTGTPKLGLDLKGGTQIMLQAQSTSKVKADAAATDRAVGVLRGRIDALGVTDPTINRVGTNRILVELPDVQDPKKAVKVIGQTAQLEFREVMSTSVTSTTKATGGQVILADESGAKLLLGPAKLTGTDIKNASAGTPNNSLGEWVVSVNFSSSGTKPWDSLITSACANTAADKRIAIVLDDKIISSPAVQSSLCSSGGGSETQISGNFTQAEAKNLAILIKGGALPVPVKIIDQSTVGPTLGKAAIHASIVASIIGLALTGLFIIVNYRASGFMATLGLAAYALISYGVLIFLGVTLTLPGLAGFVLAIGLAIDANVLVFERSREDYHEAPEHGLKPALDSGFHRAWSAIIDSNVTTILSAGLLFFLASGEVKGFGVTLSIGVLASMFSALVLARLLTDWLVRRKFVRNHPAVSGIAGISGVRRWLNNHGPFLMRRAGAIFCVSLLVAAVMIAGITIRGLSLGVDFVGGRQLEYSTAKTVNPDKARTAIAKAGFPDAIVQSASNDGGKHKNIAVRLQKISDAQAEKVRKAIASVGGETKQVSSETIDSSLGTEMRNKAILAFLIAIVVQMCYLAWRFRWTWSIAAITSMASVVLAVVGIFAWWGKTVDSVFLAAILSVIGLSVNDTIVVFDRIRERLRIKGEVPLREMVNEAILSTLPRTINTALGAFFILGSLVFLGGDSLRDFSIAVLLGLVIGHLSTVFTASTLGVLLEERWPHDPDHKPTSVDPYAYVGSGRSDGAVL